MAHYPGLVATLAELEAFYKGQNEDIGDVLELMNMTNDILDDIPWMMSNMSDGHKTRIRTGLPEVYWRRLYRGTPPSKSQIAEVKEGCGILEARAEIDVEELNLYADKAKAFRMSEGKAFMESMRQKVAKTMFYGDNNKLPDEFNGLAMRFPTLDSPHVLNAGGTGDKCTSMYLVCWGSDTIHGLYPKGSTAGLEHKDLGQYSVTDPDGNRFEVVGDKYIWRCGLSLRDWRSVVRVANIDSTKLMLPLDNPAAIDFHTLTIKAKNMMPETMRNKAIWYCNQDVMTALEIQSSDSKKLHLHYGDLFNSKAVPFIHGRPVRQCDALQNDEKALKNK